MTGPTSVLRTVGRRSVHAGVAAYLLILAPVAPARAGIGARDAEIGFDYALTRFDADLLGKTGDRWSLRAGRHETGYLQWEGQITRGSVKEVPLPGADREVTLSMALVNVVLNFHPRPGIVPYVLAGLGLAKTEVRAVGLSSGDTQGGYQIAGGSRFFFGERSAVALRVELAILASDAFEHSYFHSSIAAGLTFRIGRRAAPAAVP